MSVAQDDPYVGPWYYEQDILGFNYRITDIQCALGISQLGRLPEFMARRAAIAARYDQALSGGGLAEYFQPLGLLPGNSSAYHLYVLQLKVEVGEAPESVAERRKDLYLFLHEHGVLCQVHYIPIPWQPYFSSKYGFRRDNFPGAAAYYSRSLSLPMFSSLTDAQIDRVIDLLGSWVDLQ
jgi:dTDP-4-amino-4,6-dideoxygalactose transaminase